MSTEREQITSTLDSVFRPETDVTGGWRALTLLRLLARGEPVTIEDLAAAHGQPVREVRRALASTPDIEYDEAGRIVGAGLTLRPTPHRFEIDGLVLYTWCAMDTLVYPRLLGRPAHVTSPCRTTGARIHLTIDDTGVTSIDPPTAVVSLVTPDDLASVRTAFCNHVHFFASQDAARPWRADHPDASVLPVAEAYDFGSDVTAASCQHTSTESRC
ncbi:organomercurial lyase MerB [Amycolatopsis sp. K13G38]|uniref:Alkylmercury lyase n=1 Tax=Amycolatopsis acididurans TaxID=2724524 RepID=A0ABX1J9Q5_9PSEU|nr:organomercurial lyase MerB [Amycolatopsis acididurans]NKQ55629.1 organomercurial lyase MerB [Amycolatopsis acididurans]